MFTGEKFSQKSFTYILHVLKVWSRISFVLDWQYYSSGQISKGLKDIDLYSNSLIVNSNTQPKWYIDKHSWEKVLFIVLRNQIWAHKYFLLLLISIFIAEP